MRSLRRFNSVILFALLIPIPISGQEGTRPTLVGTIIISSELHQEEELENVIRASILAQLELDGFMPGKLHNSDYIIKASYELIGINLSISLEARQIRADGESIIVETRWEGPLSLNLDTEIQNVVHSLITLKMEKTVRTEKLEPDNKWNLDLSFSRFIPICESVQIAEAGFGGHASFGYAVLLQKFSLNPGLKVGLIWIPATCFGDSTCSDVSMVPLAVEIKLSYALNQKFHPYFTGGAGGAWLFRYNYSDKEDQAGIVPYADAAFGIDIRLADVFCIFLETELLNAFEEVSAIIPNIAHITGIALNIGTGFKY